MRFHHFDTLRNAVRIAEHPSLSDAAEALNITKGALSQQIRRLETGVGFAVFERHARGMRPTRKGQELLSAARLSFGQIEDTVERLREDAEQTLTIGTTTYFASRWLSPRLMEFLQAHPDIRLRIQPMINLDGFERGGIDLAIRWGAGDWSDCETELLFSCPAWPTGNAAAMEKVRSLGLLSAFAEFTLLRDREDSDAWSDWYARAGLLPSHRTDTLMIPDPNVRVQAVIDGQGVALNDALVEPEIARGELHRLSAVKMEDYGYYLAYPARNRQRKEIAVFIEWIRSAAAKG